MTKKNRYKGRELDYHKSIASLKRKGCSIEGNKIKTSTSRNMGNKSWGLIDFLVNWNGFILWDLPMQRKFKKD